MKNFKLTNEQYDALKWVISTVIPAFIFMVGTILTSLNYANTDIFLTIAGAVELFLGSLFMVSNSNYNKEE